MLLRFCEMQKRRFGAPLLAFVLSCAGTANVVFAADEPTAASKLELAGFVKQAGEYHIGVTAGEQQTQALELIREPILTWSNPVRNEARGAYFVWTLEGRPLVVGTIMTHPLVRDRTQRVIRHEFHSLASSEVTANFEGKTVWETRGAGVIWNHLKVAPPDVEARRRIRQMKGLARSVMTQAVTREETRKLRLLPNPLFRYKSASGNVVDGAMFAFVTGTDPEVLLLLEARAEGNGLKWYSACARQTSYELSAKLPDGSTWMVPKLDDPSDRTGTFVSLRMKVFSVE